MCASFSESFNELLADVVTRKHFGHLYYIRGIYILNVNCRYLISIIRAIGQSDLL